VVCSILPAGGNSMPVISLKIDGLNAYYFVADVHLGLKVGNPQEREQYFIAFLEGLGADTAGLFLLGDIFDFWYEYKYVIPRGYTRVLGALARVVDRGIPVHFFPGNHDLWTFGYLEQELGIKVYRNPQYMQLDGKHFLLGHGHRMGHYPFKNRILHNMFHSRMLQRAFSWLHPRWAFALAGKWSAFNRGKGGAGYVFRGEEDSKWQSKSNRESKHGQSKKNPLCEFRNLPVPATDGYVPYWPSFASGNSGIRRRNTFIHA
jgi:UDP-2,3-diacylglucosamine hydrolase